MFEDIYCAISGVAPSENEVLDGVPVNWLKVTVEKQFLNPQWAAVQMVKKGLVETTLQQLPEDQRELQRMGIQIQVAAQFHSYESDIDQWLSLYEEVYVSPPENTEQIKEEWEKLVAQLGLEEDFSQVGLDFDNLDDTKGDEEEESEEE
jgi:hypothetical protein